MPEPNCWVCHRTDFQNWDEVYQHMIDKFKMANDPHSKSRSAKLWTKKYRHRNAINKLKKIGKKNDFEGRVTLTNEQREAKEDTRRELSGKMVVVPVRCPRCKAGSRQFLEAEHVNAPHALVIDNCFVKFCEGCR